MDFIPCHPTHTLPTPQSINNCNEYELFHFFLFIRCHLRRYRARAFNAAGLMLIHGG